MAIEIGLTSDTWNTQYAPLAVLAAHYRECQRLKPLENVQIGMKTRDFSPCDKLERVLVSIWGNCTYLCEVNMRLKPEVTLAQVWHWERFVDQATLSCTLDALTPMNLVQLQTAVTQIGRSCRQTLQHDWCGYLWLDFDLSGLRCGEGAEASTKGYFSGEKTFMVVKMLA